MTDTKASAPPEPATQERVQAVLLPSQKKTAIVADSTVSLPHSLVEDLDIVVVPLEIVFGERSYRDGVDLTPQEFYRLLRESRTTPTTSMPSPGSFLEAFQRASLKASGIVCITLSQKLSSTYTSATIAAQSAGEALPGVEVRVVDSGTAAGAEALVVLAAARAACQGADPDEVESRVQEVASSVQMLAFMDTLYYVWKGGRVPRLAAWAGDLLQVKPILSLPPGGEVRLLERPHTRPQAIERLLKATRDLVGQSPIRVNVIHADAPQEAEALRRRVEAEFQCREVIVTEFSPVIGAHTGPGLLGLAFHEEP